MKMLELNCFQKNRFRFPVPVEVFPAVDPVEPCEALLVEPPPAVAALDALRVPGLLQHCRHELVVDRAGAAHADHLE